MLSVATFMLLFVALQCTLTNAASNNTNFTVISGSKNTLATALSASDQEKLRIAAKAGESHTVNITDNGSRKLIFAQERVFLSLDCLPFLQRIKRLQDGGAVEIQWFFQQLSEAGVPTSNRTQLIPTPGNRLDFQRILVGGDSNRWLNITQTIAVPGAEGPDNKIFTCRIVISDDEESEALYESSVELRMVGEPPVIIRGNGSSPVEQHGQTSVRYNIGAEICISRNNPTTISLACQIPYGPPLAYPTPNRTWTKDATIVINSTEHGKNPDLASFLDTQLLLMPGSLHPTPLSAAKDGSITFTTRVRRISSPARFMEGYTLDDARNDLFEFLLGTWTCGVSNRYGFDVVSTVISDCAIEHLSAPSVVEGYCSHVYWRNSPDVLCKDVRGYDVRLFNPDTGAEVVRRVDSRGTFYSLQADDEALKSESTLFQVRIVSSSLSSVGAYSTTTKLGCGPVQGPKEQPTAETKEQPTTEPKEQPTPEPAKVYFELNGNIIPNNSMASFLSMGEGDNALLCKTNKVACCGNRPNRYGDFYFPNGRKVPVIGLAGGAELYRNRGNQLIRLNRRSGVVSPRGKYRCEIPDDSDVMQKIFITLN